jgi:hypothetical protein
MMIKGNGFGRKRGRGLIEVLARNLPGGTEENRGNLRTACVPPSFESSIYRIHFRALPLDQHIRRCSLENCYDPVYFPER